MANQKFPQDLAIRFSVGDAKWLNERTEFFKLVVAQVLVRRRV